MKKIYLIVMLAMLSLGVVYAQGSVNINTADAKTLAATLDGVGLSKARAIVEYRQQNGAFKSVDEIVKVNGIGLATLAKNRALMRLVEPKSTTKQQHAG